MKKEKPPFFPTEVEPEVPKVEIPDDLKCSLCNNLLQDAVLIPCCGNSFCDECNFGRFLEPSYSSLVSSSESLQESLIKLASLVQRQAQTSHLAFTILTIHCDNLICTLSVMIHFESTDCDVKRIAFAVNIETNLLVSNDNKTANLLIMRATWFHRSTVCIITPKETPTPGTLKPSWSANNPFPFCPFVVISFPCS